MTGAEKGKIKLARTFSEPLRTDLIKKAVLAEQSLKRQPYGADMLAGKRTSAHYHGRRQIRFTMMNREMARMARIHGKVGYLAFRARFVPQAVKGRKAHPPKTEKNWEKKINIKEWEKALNSAIAASAKKELVEKRNHNLNGVKNIPLVVDDKIQEIKKTSELKEFLKKIGLEKELERTAKKKERAGRGKTRGRRTKTRRGPLIIVKQDKGIGKAGKNIPGLDITSIKKLSVEMLAPGTVPGRLCIWTKSAAEDLGK